MSVCRIPVRRLNAVYLQKSVSESFHSSVTARNDYINAVVLTVLVSLNPKHIYFEKESHYVITKIIVILSNWLIPGQILLSTYSRFRLSFFWIYLFKKKCYSEILFNYTGLWRTSLEHSIGQFRFFEKLGDIVFFTILMTYVKTREAYICRKGDAIR